MAKVDGMDRKMDGVTAKVDDAVKLAHEAKDQVKLVEVKVLAFQGEIDSMRKELNNSHKEKEVWKASVISASDTGISAKLHELEETLKKMESVDREKPLDDHTMSMVIGGAGAAGDEEEAIEWTISQLKSL